MNSKINFNSNCVFVIVKGTMTWLDNDSLHKRQTISCAFAGTADGDVYMLSLTVCIYIIRSDVLNSIVCFFAYCFIKWFLGGVFLESCREWRPVWMAVNRSLCIELFEFFSEFMLKFVNVKDKSILILHKWIKSLLKWVYLHFKHLFS